MRIFLHLLFVAMALTGCQPAQVLPVVDEVKPNWGYNAETTEISIRGEGFFAAVSASDGGIGRYDRDFLVSLVGPQGEERLEGVQQLSEDEIVAVVPAGLAAGWFDVRVITPAQGQADLIDAFEVTATKADTLEVEASSTNLDVSGLSIVRLKVLNPDGVVVQEAFPVTVRLTPTRTLGEGFGVDPGNLLDVEVGPDGLGFSGLIGPTGEAYFIVSSSEPDDMVVEAEVSIRDRATIAGAELISFKAGAVRGLNVSLPSGLEATQAGEAFDVVLSLVDEGGNTVSGQPVTVVLSEGCGAGAWEDHITFVDSATVTVVPTRACEANTIGAFGVIEGGSVSGQSRSFAVLPGPQARLSVLATPDVVQAGSGDVVFFVTGEDEWGNGTAEPLADLALFDDDGLVSEGNGNGTYSCGSLMPGTAQCIARLYRASAMRMIRVTSTTGIEGLANPIQVLPGPGDRVSVVLGVSAVTAGETFTAEVAVEDEFANPVALDGADLAGMVFTDDYGSVDCTLKESDALARRSAFDCTVTVAVTENELHVQVPTFGVIGHSELFRVDPGPLHTIDLTIDEDILADGASAGEPIPLAAEGLDAFGNRVSGSWTVDLRNVAGGMDVETLTLADGVAFQWVVMTQAARGDSIWALDGLLVFGGSAGFDVHPGAPSGVVASVARPWAMVGQPIDVEMSLVDDYGNPAFIGEVAYEIDPIGGLGPPLTGVLDGPTAVPVVFESAGLGEDLLVQVGEYSTAVLDLDVALDCGLEAREIEAAGVVDGRVCLGDGATVSLDWGSDELVHASVTRDGMPLLRGDTTGVEVDLVEAGRTQIDAMFISDDACGEVSHLDLFAGSVGDPVGLVDLFSATDTLLAGAEDPLGSTDVLIEARECSGDPAALSALHVRTDSGDIIVEDEGGSVLSTGEGLHVMLDEAGEAMVSLSVADTAGEGAVSMVVGTSSGAASGLAVIDVTGDAIPPRVLRVSPSGTVSGWVSEIQVRFSERMLWVEGLLPSGTYFDLIGPSGASVEVASAAWGEGVETLTLTLSEPVDLSAEAITLELYDTLRDAAGNRLDGDFDGTSTGDWVRSFGDVPDEAPDVTRCEVSSGWFRPDGDDGEGIHTDQVWLSMEATGPSEWWRIDILDPDEGFVTRHVKPRIRPLDGSFVFDGRDGGGRVLSEGMVVLEVHAMDDYGNLGRGCRAAVVIEQVVSIR